MHLRLVSLCAMTSMLLASAHAQEIDGELPAEEIIYRDAELATSRLWGGAEYLFWWTKDAPQPVPLITNNGPINGEGIQVLMGGEDVSLHPSSGLRANSGWWLDAEQVWGLEVGGFYLGRTSDTQSIGADATGAPVLTIPFFDEQLALENYTFVSFTNTFSGTAVLNVASELYGLESNIVRTLSNNRSGRFAVLTGFRYVNLYESLNFFTTTELIDPLEGSLTTSDTFRTYNEFYGGQLGASLDRSFGIFYARAMTKVALGSMQQTVRINGSSTATPGNDFLAPTYFPAGYFAVPSNEGTFHSERFAVIPQVDLTIGVQLTDNLRATVGYTFLFLSSVMRPGDQMDRRINTSQAPAYNGETSLTGAAAPRPLLDVSTYWAQGLTAGLEYIW